MAEVKTDVTLNIGENGAADRASVSIHVRTGTRSNSFPSALRSTCCLERLFSILSPHRSKLGT